jgi:hypothetical protein
LRLITGSEKGLKFIFVWALRSKIWMLSWPIQAAIHLPTESAAPVSLLGEVLGVMLLPTLAARLLELGCGQIEILPMGLEPLIDPQLQNRVCSG